MLRRVGARTRVTVTRSGLTNHAYAPVQPQQKPICGERGNRAVKRRQKDSWGNRPRYDPPTRIDGSFSDKDAENAMTMVTLRRRPGVTLNSVEVREVVAEA
jgi:hypothetical protein